jgi:hypothetical protein
MDAVDYNKQNAVHVEDETASKDKPIYHENASPEGEVLETRYARESGSWQSVVVRIRADPRLDSRRTSRLCQVVLEGHHLLLHPALGGFERWCELRLCGRRNCQEKLTVVDRQFQQQIPGNIIPLPAFIRTMADTVIDGEPAISAKVVSYWQGFAEMSKTLGMFTGGTFADRFGRK